MIISLLPQDTRIVEIVSALSLILLSVVFSYSSNVGISLFLYESVQFWSVVIFSLGFLQFMPLVLYPKLELLRCIMSWVNGSFWVWVSLTSVFTISPGAILIAQVGIANLYSFIINVNLLGGPWGRK